MAFINTHLKKNSWMIVVVVLASWLRITQINTQAILFGDAGRDLLAARQAVEDGSPPLLGIPSSIPRFHQGPLTIWLEMAIYALFGHHTLAFSVIFAFLGIMTVIMVYEYATLYLDQKTGIVAAALLAFSPLAIAHSRVPYHLTPIPLVMTLFLFSLMYLWQNKKWGVFVAMLSWTLLMQFELSLFALGLMIPYILYRHRRVVKVSLVSQASSAVLIGFLPQIIHDLSRPITQSQLGGFSAWVGYRLVALTGAVGDHRLSINRLMTTLSSYWQYWQRIFGVENVFISIVFLGLLISTIHLLIKNRKTLVPGIELPAVTSLLLTLSYFIHGSPSEAYFPPYFVLLSLLIGWRLWELFKKRQPLFVLTISIWALVNIVAIQQHSFFVSNLQKFSYGASVQEQKEMIQYFNQISNNSWQLKTTHPAGKFISLFDNFRWLALEVATPEDLERGMIFYIEDKSSGLAGYPGLTRVEFTTLDVYHF